MEEMMDGCRHEDSAFVVSYVVIKGGQKEQSSYQGTRHAEIVVQGIKKELAKLQTFKAKRQATSARLLV